jgi:hypothetical protein
MISNFGLNIALATEQVPRCQTQREDNWTQYDNEVKKETHTAIPALTQQQARKRWFCRGDYYD